MAGGTPAYAWMNGEIVPGKDAKINIHSEAFLRGANVFDALAVYATVDKQQVNLFRTAEHLDRLYNSSMKILRMQIKWTQQDLTRAMLDTVRANNTRGDAVVRTHVYFGEGAYYGFDPKEIETGCAIMVTERPSWSSATRGLNVCVSSWRRIDDEVMPPRVKAVSNYLNSRYVMMEVRLEGYDAAIILNRSGKVAEGQGACMMMVRNGKVVTPPVTAGLLESVTRATLMELFRKELGMEVVERDIDRTELYIADEVFFVGTTAEVQPIVSVDKYQIGNGQMGPVVKAMQEVYFNIARGGNPKYSGWLIPVY